MMATRLTVYAHPWRSINAANAAQPYLACPTRGATASACHRGRFTAQTSGNPDARRFPAPAGASPRQPAASWTTGFRTPSWQAATGRRPGRSAPEPSLLDPPRCSLQGLAGRAPNALLAPGGLIPGGKRLLHTPRAAAGQPSGLPNGAGTVGPDHGPRLGVGLRPRASPPFARTIT
jgi:hypothetical protein